MTAVDLDAIKARYDRTRSPIPLDVQVYVYAEVAADVPALLSLVEELSAERDEQAELARKTLAAATDEHMRFAAENARLRQQLAAAEAETRDGQAWDDLVAERDDFRRLMSETAVMEGMATAQVAAMTPVVEAARACVVDAQAVSYVRVGLAAAVDTYDARQQGQDGAETGLSATETRERCPHCGPGYRYGDEGCRHEPVLVGCPTCRTILRPSLVPGGCADPWHAENAPADPAGLDAAIEAACIATYHDPHMPYGEEGWGHARDFNRTAYRETVAAIVHAAAVHIRRAALLEAADAIEADPFPDIPDDIKRIYAAGLRQLAEREDR